eukprot:305801-Rhodomonas_salina.1
MVVATEKNLTGEPFSPRISTDSSSAHSAHVDDSTVFDATVVPGSGRSDVRNEARVVSRRGATGAAGHAEREVEEVVSRLEARPASVLDIAQHARGDGAVIPATGSCT